MRTKDKRLLAFAAVVVAVPLLLTPAAPARPTAKTINVTLLDSRIALSSKTAPVGTVTFVVRNKGKAKHNFKILTKKTPTIAPGKGSKLIVKFAKKGKFPYSSTLPGDAKKGLKGVFTLTGGAPTGGTNLAAGKKVFVDTACGSCHTFKAAGSIGTIGPNLDSSGASRATIVLRVTNGKGTMTPYKDVLTAKQIQDVSDFVFQARAG
jgi:cytochrome c553